MILIKLFIFKKNIRKYCQVINQLFINKVANIMFIKLNKTTMTTIFITIIIKQ